MAESYDICEPKSQKHYDFIWSNADITVFGGAAGSGKAQPLDAKVLTPSGWKLMGDIKVGSKVTTPDGGVANVTAVYPFDGKPVYEIKTKTGRKTRACDEHLWKVKYTRHKRKSVVDVIQTKEIIKLLESGQKVMIPTYSEGFEISDSYSELPFDPYMMGFLLGDGGMTKSRITLSTIDKPIVDIFKRSLEKYGCELTQMNAVDYVIVNKDGSDFKRDRLGRFQTTNQVTEIFKNLGLVGRKSHDKFIPKEFLQASAQDRIDLLKGLLDSDGYSGKGVIEYSTISKDLCDGVVELVRSLGGKARVTERVPTYEYKGEKCYGSNSFRVYIHFKDQSKYFNLERKKKVTDKEVFDEIESVTYVGVMPAQCISIDSEEHLYITDDYIVTHNTWQGLCRFLRFINEPQYIGYVIRKTQASLKHGAFKTAIRLFTAWESKIKINRVDMTITFPSGAVIIFKGLDGSASIEYFQGQEISGALVDEATHIKYEEISWLMTRLRTNADVHPTVWFTCNPDPDHFIAEWVDPYLYPKNTYKTIDGVQTNVGGRADPELNGKLKWYYVIDNYWHWNDDREALIEEFKHIVTDKNQKPMSFRFIGATFADNPVLCEEQPAYINSLLNKDRVERERLAFGNWYIREEGAGYWKKEWVKLIKQFPTEDDPTDSIDTRVRCWDIAYTEPHEGNPDPDYTASVLMARTKHGYYIVEHVHRIRIRVGALYAHIAEVALQDYDTYGIFTQYIPEDPAAGKATYLFARDYLRARDVQVNKVKGGQQRSKLERFKNFAAASQNKSVYVWDTSDIKDPIGNWNDYYFTELEVFDGSRNVRHDDMVDATSDGFNVLYRRRRVSKKAAGRMF